MENFQKKWNELLNSEEGEKVKRLLAIDDKTQRGNGNKNQKGNHIVSAVDERGFCLGQKRVEEKTNEITAIPELIDSLNIKGTIITTDAMGTQTAIVKKIRKKRADYVLALKGNQGSLLDELTQIVQTVQKEPLVQEYSVLAGVAQRQRRYSCFALDALVVVKMDIAVNHFICFGEGCRLMAVDALCFENGEEIFCHCIVIWVSTS